MVYQSKNFKIDTVPNLTSVKSHIKKCKMKLDNSFALFFLFVPGWTPSQWYVTRYDTKLEYRICFLVSHGIYPILTGKAKTNI